MNERMAIYANGLNIAYNNELNEAMFVFYQEIPALGQTEEGSVETIEVARIAVGGKMLDGIEEILQQIKKAASDKVDE